MAYFEMRSAPILEAQLGKLQNKLLLMKIVAKVKTVVGKLKKTNKDKFKRFKRAPPFVWVNGRAKPNPEFNPIRPPRNGGLCICTAFCAFSKCLWHG